MNERIRKFIRTKSAILFPGTDTVDCQIDDIEKFAELLVRECAGLFPAEYDTVEGKTTIGKIIKNHFGVE